MSSLFMKAPMRAPIAGAQKVLRPSQRGSGGNLSRWFPRAQNPQLLRARAKGAIAVYHGKFPVAGTRRAECHRALLFRRTKLMPTWPFVFLFAGRFDGRNTLGDVFGKKARAQAF